MVILASVPCEYKEAKAELRHLSLWIILTGRVDTVGSGVLQNSSAVPEGGALGPGWQEGTLVEGAHGAPAARMRFRLGQRTGTPQRVRVRVGRRSGPTSGLKSPLQLTL